MALVTVQRSPSVSSSPQSSDSGAGAPADEDDATRGCKSLSECYFAGKGAALILPPNERARPSRRVSAAGCDIQQHLQSMFWLLRPEETLKMAVKLESVHPGRTRYLVVVSCNGNQDAEESCLLGIDCHAQATVGLVLRVLADTAITLDGDGGFSVSVCGRQHIFKPVSVQAMWSALQTLHKVSSKAREQNYFAGGLSHDWVSYYEQRIASDRSCLNEWNAMDNLESRRPPSPDSVRTKPREREETERVIRATLKEIMMSVDLDEVTSKYIRGKLEEELDMDLGEFKPFIDQEMLTILGQMDAPTEIFDHVYLGSEWNASNLEELQKNGVRHILNVTREIDNFFPGMFDYRNVRVYDDEKTDLLKHWDDTFKYITKAKKEGSKVLVHCKMGVSRSASVVIAYAMKAYNWDFTQAWRYVKDKRNCIKPNSSFLLQLETYQGILDAMKNKEKLQRSKSDTNLKSPTRLCRTKAQSDDEKTQNNAIVTSSSGVDLKKRGERPKSWSPYVEILDEILPNLPLSQSLESIDKTSEVSREDLLRPQNSQKQCNVLMPCDNGQSYSVSQNQIFHLPGPDTPTASTRIPKKFIYPQKKSPQVQKRRGLVLNLTNQFEAAGSKPGTPEDQQFTPDDSKNSIKCDKEIIQKSDNDFKIHNDMNIQKVDCDSKFRRKFDKSHKTMQKNERISKIGKTVTNSIGKTDNPTNDARNLQKYEKIPRKSQRIDKEKHFFTSNTDSRITQKPEIINYSQKIQQDIKIPQKTENYPRSLRKQDDSIESQEKSQTCKLKRDDPFSAQLDKVFDREERREPLRESPSRQNSWSSHESGVVMDNNTSVHSSWATLPSRNSSWGSYDMRPDPRDPLGSSGLFPYDREEIPWHPGTVKRTKQKLEEGNVKRVCTQTDDEKVRTEEMSITDGLSGVLLGFSTSPTPLRRDNDKLDVSGEFESSNSRIIDISDKIISRQIDRLSTSAPVPSSLSIDNDAIGGTLRTCRSESETSSPLVIDTTQCSSVKHHKMILENLSNKSIVTKRFCSVDDSPPEIISSSSSSSSSSGDGHRGISGIVKNLKKEFEAKSSKFEKSPDFNETIEDKWSKKEGKVIRSLPSSPVISHNDGKIKCLAKSLDDDGQNGKNVLKSNEDLSVKVLVDKYEKPCVKRSDVLLRGCEAHPPAKSKIATQELSRRSAPIMINSGYLVNEGIESGRPPVGPCPSVVVASVVAKAANKKQQQHGRTHPLARLQVRPRHSSPVYNTM